MEAAAGTVAEDAVETVAEGADVDAEVAAVEEDPLVLQKSTSKWSIGFAVCLLRATG